MDSSNKQIFTAYWTGYQKSENTPDTIPDGVDKVIFAFFGPINNKVETTFITSLYSADKLKAWIKQLKERGIIVMASLLDTPQTHWNQVDMTKFIPNLEHFIIEWGFDGIDIDAESGMPSSVYVENFISLIKGCRSILPPSSPLSYTCYMGAEGYDGDILRTTIDEIDFVQLMAYGDGYQSMISLFNDYKQVVPQSKLLIGVMPGMTALQETVKLTDWNSKEKGGIMLWNICRDQPSYSEKPRWSFYDAILQNIKRKSNTKDIKDIKNKNKNKNTWWFF